MKQVTCDLVVHSFCHGHFECVVILRGANSVLLEGSQISFDRIASTENVSISLNGSLHAMMPPFLNCKILG